MKKIMALVILSTSIFANTIQSAYLQNSNLNPELQQEVIEAVRSFIPCLNAYGLTELNTTVEIDRVDQGVIDKFYATTFRANLTYDYHPKQVIITVRSAHYAGSNPTVKWTEILEVSSNSPISCD